MGSKSFNWAVEILTKGTRTMVSNKNRAAVNKRGSMSLRAIFMTTILKPHIAATRLAPKAGFANQSICFMPVSMGNI